ncbi:MAG: hypothetical protein JWO30_51 [Fibrobacteres bacterium]|nr:hypothetical protein [Fibrobacterota bacterium]
MIRIILLCAATGYCAPFCVVTGSGKNCWYYDANDCRRDAARAHGACIYSEEKPNAESQPSRPATVYVPVPTPQFAPIVGFGVTAEGINSAVAAGKPFADAARQQQENARKQKESDSEIPKIESESRLMDEETKYNKPKHQEKPEPSNSKDGLKTPIEWAEGIIADSASDIHTLESACEIYHREAYSKKKNGEFDPNEWLCLKRVKGITK